MPASGSQKHALEMIFEGARLLGWDIAIAGIPRSEDCPGLIVGELGLIQMLTDDEEELDWTLTLPPSMQ